MHRWVPSLSRAGLDVHRLDVHRLDVHRLDEDGFGLLDDVAGYWVSEQDARVRDVRRVDDCLAALAEHDVEVCLADTDRRCYRSPVGNGSFSQLL
ncbi:DUF6886 family protein [Actinoplanes sp. NPDC051851]|uniref:DUF6886 family protein n=1 Tax=Actinoplanes sp. NPDC051851 TaxID=3154753 RepID=UPI00344A2E67